MILPTDQWFYLQLQGSVKTGCSLGLLDLNRIFPGFRYVVGTLWAQSVFVVARKRMKLFKERLEYQ